MNEELNLVKDLAVILISAGVFTIISKAFKQPLILGYIIAGFLIGPNMPYFFGIQSTETIHQWSEIGMIFMMFGLGLEFSFKKLMKVGSAAGLTAAGKFFGVFVIGFIVGQALGWSTMESIFLAGLLSMSSTIVVLKSYDDYGLKDRPFAGVVFGTLVIEDLIAILLMVLLSTMAVSNKFAGAEMFSNLLKLAFFLILWFVVGIYVIPTLLKKARKYLNNEILLLVSLGLCFCMVAFATAVGFSSALGAFVMGSILAETIESEHIHKLVTPIKDLFGAIFFVSVGMMLSPKVIVENWAIILLLTVIVYITHILFAGAGVILAGKGLKNAVYTGFSLAQLGEFGFIIAGVGVSLGVMRDFIYPVIIAVSVITTFTTPYFIKLAEPAHNFLLRKLPERWIRKINQYETQGARTITEDSEWRKLLKALGVRVVFYGVMILAIVIGMRAFVDPFLAKVLSSWSENALGLLSVGLTLALVLPFLYGLSISSSSFNNSAMNLLKEKQSNQWPLMSLMFLRIFIGVGIILGIIANRIDLSWWSILLIIVGGAAFLFMARYNLHKYSVLEERFLANLNEKEVLARKNAPVMSSVNSFMEGYDAKTKNFTVSPDSRFVGKCLKDLPFRAKTGVNIIKITRGTLHIVIPDASEIVYPDDVLLAVGTESQLNAFGAILEESIVIGENIEEQKFKVTRRILSADSPILGKMLKDLNLKKFRCMVISVQREGDFIANPPAEWNFHEGDIVWFAGETARLGEL